jgi:hypothetical protein
VRLLEIRQAAAAIHHGLAVNDYPICSEELGALQLRAVAVRLDLVDPIVATRWILAEGGVTRLDVPGIEVLKAPLTRDTPKRVTQRHGTHADSTPSR